MTIRIQADTGTKGVSHRFYPGARPWGTINFGKTGHANNLYFDDTADIDAVIAELAALRAEMTAPAVTCSERTCGQANPDSGAWCHLPAPHAEHRDTDGETWTTGARPDDEADGCPCGHAQAGHAFSDDVCAVPECPCPGYRPAAPAQAGPPFHVTGTLADPCKAEDNHYICTAQDGHDGPLHVAYGTHGEVYHRWAVTEPAQDETPAAAAAFCPDAYTAPGVEYYCTLKAGHKGLHAQLTSTGAFVAEWGYEDGHVHTTSGHQPAQAETQQAVSA